MKVRRITRRDLSAVQRLLNSNSEYSRRVTGEGPVQTAADEIFAALPPDVDPSQKVNLGLWDGADLIAFADVIIGWPDASTAHVGLLITDGARQGEGFGRTMHDAVARLVSENPPIRTLRISIVDTNADLAERFWVKLGYEPTGEASPYSSGSVESIARIWMRPVGPLPRP